MYQMIYALALAEEQEEAFIGHFEYFQQAPVTGAINSSRSNHGVGKAGFISKFV